MRAPTASYLLAACLLGCAAADAPPDIVLTVDTLPDGAVRVRNPMAGLWGGGNARFVEETRIGSVEGGEPYALGSVYDATLDPAGRIYVAERQASEVRVFDADGRHVRTLGRKGKGPGEFEGVYALLWGPHGNLWVLDGGNQRWSVFDTAGALVDTHRREGTIWGVGLDARFDAEGRLYERTGFCLAEDDCRGYMLRYVPGPDAEVDTVAMPPDTISAYIEVELGRRRAMLPLPYAPEPSMEFDRSGGYWTGTGERYELERWSWSGARTRLVQRPHVPEPVSGADRDSARVFIEDLLGRMDMARGVTQVDLGRIPDVKPAWLDFTVSDRGELWLARHLPWERVPYGPIAFDVFDPDGRYLGAVEDVPVGGRPMPRIIGDRLVGVVHDRLEVPWVVAGRIERPLAGNR